MVSLVLQKTPNLSILCKEDAQNREFPSFFRRIEDTITCFRDGLTFRKYLCLKNGGFLLIRGFLGASCRTVMDGSNDIWKACVYLLNYVRQGSFNWKDVAHTSYISENNLGIILTGLANFWQRDSNHRPLVSPQTCYQGLFRLVSGLL